MRFRWFQPQDSLFVVDNSAKDLDPTVGVVKIAAPTAKGYKACVRGTTTHFAADTVGASYPTCNSKSWLSFDIALGNVFMRRKPQLELFMRSGMNANWPLLPGGAIHMEDALSPWKTDFYDGQSGDDPMVNDGKIIVNLPRESFYVFQPLKAPTGKYEFYSNQLLYGGPFKWEEKHHFDFYWVPAVY